MNTTSLPPERWACRLPPDPVATERLGEAIGQHLGGGAAIGLLGDLGAGKTTFVRGLARGVRVVDPDAVASPTYLLVIEHEGAPRLLHADAYLPQKLEGFLGDGGLEYLFQADAVTVVEWADRVAGAMPAHTLWLQLALATDGGRVVRGCWKEAGDYPWMCAIGENPAAN